MIELLKKLLVLTVAVAVLFILMYVAFYLFLVALVVIISAVIYVKIKGLTMQDFRHKAPHYWWRHGQHPNQDKNNKTQETVIIESVEYEDITPKDK